MHYVGIAKTTIRPLFWFSVVIVLLSFTVGLYKFETPTHFQNHLSTHQLNGICTIKKDGWKDIEKDLSRKKVIGGCLIRAFVWFLDSEF
jgi:hypothetical protein